MKKLFKGMWRKYECDPYVEIHIGKYSEVSGRDIRGITHNIENNS